MSTKRVDEVIAFEQLRSGLNGSRRAIVRWTDGTVGEALRWYDDEVLISEGDIVGRCEADLCALLHLRDVDYLQRDDGS